MRLYVYTVRLTLSAAHSVELLPDENMLPQAIRMSEVQCQNAFVRAEVSGLLFRDKASQPCYALMKHLLGKR